VFIALIQKELRLLRANGVLVVTLALFSLVLAVLLSYALRRVGSPLSERQFLIPGMLVAGGLFVATGLFAQTALLERDGEALRGLRMAGFHPQSLFLSKLLSNLLLFVVLQLFLAFALALLFEETILRLSFEIFLLELLFGAGICALGTLLSMISALAPQREILFPILFFPLVIPICGAAIVLLHQLFDTGALELVGFPAKLLAGCAVLYTALGALLFEEVAQ